MERINYKIILNWYYKLIIYKTMKCKQVHKNLIGYIEETLPMPLSADLHNHIDKCTDCKALYENILATYTVFNQLPKPEINPFFYTRLEQKIKSKKPSEILLMPLFLRRVQLVAATVLIAVGISFGILIGKNLANSQLAKTSIDQNAILEAYASEYYLTGTGDDIVDAFVNN